MSKTTIRKRIALTAISALFAGMLTVASAPVATAHNAVGQANVDADTTGTISASLFVATLNSTGTAATQAVHNVLTSALGFTSKGLLAKDGSSGTAQTATVLAGGQLSLYAEVSTAVGFSVSGGSLSNLVPHFAGASATYNSNNTAAITAYTATTGANSSTGTAVIWTAPSTAGTYTINMLTGFPQDANASTYSFPTTSSMPTTLGGKITVTVVAASSGGSYSAAYSACNTNVRTLTENTSATTPYPNGIDSVSSVADGGNWFIDFNLNDAYNANLDPGNIVVSATNGALVNIGTDAGATPSAGTASTDTNFSNGSDHTVIIAQPTAGAPLTTTVTITYNGTTVCTKTVTIRGKVASLEVANIGTGSLSSQAGSSIWIESNAGTIAGLPAGLFTVVAKDSAGNLVHTPTTLGSYGVVSSTLTTTVQNVSVTARSTSASTTSNAHYNVGTWLCGAVAGEANVKIKFTSTASGEVVESPAFKARCADSPYTFTVALDKASYTQGEIATATVQFLDSKGNKANSVAAPGANTWTMPMLTSVDWPTGGSATAVTKTDGTMVYKWTVGTTGTFSPGTYSGVISYSALAASTNATPTYKVSSGGDTTTNADVLKSIVALIASINKQIQALQKLILARR